METQDKAHPSALSNGAHCRRRMNEVSIDSLTHPLKHTFSQKLIIPVHGVAIRFSINLESSVNFVSMALDS